MKRPKTYAEYNLPLHVKIVPRINFVAARSFVPQTHIADFDERWNEITDPSKLLSLFPCPAKLIEADLTFSDHDLLIRAAYVEETQNPLGAVRVVTIQEKPHLGKFTRRRMLAIPEALNRRYIEPGIVNFTTWSDTVADLSTPGAITLDFEAWYSHFSLPESCRDFYAYSFHGKTYRLKVVPTGARGLVCIAHSITFGLTQHIAARFEVAVRAYLDNIKIAGEQHECSRAAEALIALTTTLDATLKIESAWNTQYDWLGARCFHNSPQPNATQSLPKIMSKLDDILACVLGPTATVRDGMRLLGVTVWCSRIDNVCLGHFYFFLKFMRRRSPRSPDAPLQIWPCVANVISNLGITLKKQTPRQHGTPSQFKQHILFTDACLTGWGAFFFDGFDAKCFFGSFDPIEDRNIANLEAVAALNGIKNAPVCPCTSENANALLLLVDNTSIISTLNHHHVHPSKRIQDIANMIKPIAISKGFSLFKCAFVPTTKNLADKLSRFSQML